MAYFSLIFSAFLIGVAISFLLALAVSSLRTVKTLSRVCASDFS